MNFFAVDFFSNLLITKYKEIVSVDLHCTLSFSCVS